MGFQMTAFMQKREGDKWVNIDILPRDEFESEHVETCYCRTDIHNQKHWDWLGMSSIHDPQIWGDEIPPHLTPRGLPEDIQPDSFEWDTLDDSHYPSWIMLDELLATEWDLVYNFYDGEPQRSLREYLGQPFIDWLHTLKDKGVERIVYSFG